MGGKTVNENLWNASLSTMWAMTNFSTMQEFCLAAHRMGFAGIELNHQVDSRMLAGLDLSHCQVTSIHEPCPADIRMDDLKSKDWLISAEDEHNRREGVIAVQRSIDLAASLGVKAIIVHAGNVCADWETEKKLYEEFKAGHARTTEYRILKDLLIQERKALAPSRMAAVKKSLLELLDICRPLGIRLGLENRYHYMDIPLIDELDELLALGEPEELGFWFDAGHAQTLDRLGFTPYKEWLERYSKRIVGVHLHDAVGISDHRAPGSGEINFDQVQKFIPEGAVITLEIRPSTTAEQVISSLQFLVETGCIEVRQ